MRPNSRTTAQGALVSLLFSLLTLETLDSVASFAGGLATALMEEATYNLACTRRGTRF